MLWLQGCQPQLEQPYMSSVPDSSSGESLVTQDYIWAMWDCGIAISYSLIVTIERHEKKLLPRQNVDCTVDQEAADGWPLEGVIPTGLEISIFQEVNNLWPLCTNDHTNIIAAA